MENQKKLIFIDGNFSPQESKEILMNIFRSKIQFHKSKNFSSSERFGKNDDIAEKRIPELQKSIEVLNEILNQAEKDNLRLEIKSEISISFL